jgi:hypothetical protein
MSPSQHSNGLDFGPPSGKQFTGRRVTVGPAAETSCPPIAFPVTYRRDALIPTGAGAGLASCLWHQPRIQSTPGASAIARDLRRPRLHHQPADCMGGAGKRQDLTSRMPRPCLVNDPLHRISLASLHGERLKNELRQVTDNAVSAVFGFPLNLLRHAQLCPTHPSNKIGFAIPFNSAYLLKCIMAQCNQ